MWQYSDAPTVFATLSWNWIKFGSDGIHYGRREKRYDRVGRRGPARPVLAEDLQYRLDIKLTSLVARIECAVQDHQHHERVSSGVIFVDRVALGLPAAGVQTVQRRVIAVALP
jgi:hypothetical protein